MFQRVLRGVQFCLLLAAMSGAMSEISLAQSLVLDLPRQSQRAQVSQRIGITDITISYHRPLVNDRKVWDALVPYGKVWRAGANENTTITFSDPVQIEGKPLDRGIYGLHMIPTADEWTPVAPRARRFRSLVVPYDEQRPFAHTWNEAVLRWQRTGSLPTSPSPAPS